MEILWYLGCALAAYFLGSIPTGYWLGRARGVDIRKVGSGNIGATNTLRALGKTMGALALLGDLAKGFIAVAFPPLAAEAFGFRGDRVLLQIACAMAVIAGHNWTIFLGFKGGKGVATSAGAMLALAPLALLASATVFLVIVWLSRIVSLGSLLAAVAVVAFAWLWPGHGSLMPYPISLKIFVSLMGGAVIWKHRANMGRLINGTEPRIVGRRGHTEAK